MSINMTRDPIWFRSSSFRRRLMRSFFQLFGASYSRLSTRAEILRLFQMMWPSEIAGGLCRFGTEGDGGYLIPAAMPSVDTLFSPGVSHNVDFEIQILRTYPGCQVYLIDGSIPANPLAEFGDRVEWVCKYLASETRGEELAFRDWVRPRSSSNGAILSMDIEGGEYDVLSSLCDSDLSPFDLLIIEFHGLQICLSREGCQLLKGILNRLTAEFGIIHCHCNNYADPFCFQDLLLPQVMELTFARRGKFELGAPVDDLPHPLDSLNTQSKQGYALYPQFKEGVLFR